MWLVYWKIGLGTSLLTHPCRLQLFVSALPLLGCLMQWIAYSLVVFKYAAASVVPPGSGCADNCRTLQVLDTSSMVGRPSPQPKAQKGHAMLSTAGALVVASYIV